MDLILCWVMAVALCAAPLALSQEECERFSRRPDDTVVAERGMACLYCDYPSVDDIVWLRGSTAIETGMDSTVCNCRASAAPGQPLSLCFDSVQREDADRYSCRAHLGFVDVRECSARLILAGAPNITRRDPANADVVIAIGATENITINYNPGNPIATVQWSKDGQLINDSRVITAPNSTTLTLTNNNATIRGRYLVNVSNIGGSDTFQYNVKAEFAPVINLTIAPLDPNRVRLTCSARGYPRLDSVAWERASDGSAVSGSVDEINGEESPMFDFSLTSTLDRERSQCDGVVYRCTVTQGSTRKSTSITCQIAVPPVPQNLEITVHNSTAVLVNWTRSDTAVSYDVEYRLQDSATWILQRTAAPPLIIGNLVEGNTYFFRARSRSSTSTSDFSPEELATIRRVTTSPPTTSSPTTSSPTTSPPTTSPPTTSPPTISPPTTSPPTTSPPTASPPTTPPPTSLPPTPTPLVLSFINDSPRVQGNNISVDVQTSRPVLTLVCSLTDLPNQDCSSGSTTFTNVPPRANGRPYILRVVGKTTDGVRTVLRKVVRIEEPGICAVHLIGDGVTVNGDTATVHFASIGPSNSFLCSLDRQNFIQCSSGKEFSRLSSGQHRLKIVPNNCGRNRRPLVAHFVVE